MSEATPVKRRGYYIIYKTKLNSMLYTRNIKMQVALKNGKNISCKH